MEYGCGHGSGRRLRWRGNVWCRAERVLPYYVCGKGVAHMAGPLFVGEGLRWVGELCGNCCKGMYV